MRGIIVFTTNSYYNLLSYLQRFWHMAKDLLLLFLLLSLLLYLWPLMGPQKHRKSDLGSIFSWPNVGWHLHHMTFFPGYILPVLKLVELFILRPVHIYTQVLLLRNAGKIYLPSSSPSESQRNYSHWPCQARDRPGIFPGPIPSVQSP